MSYKSQPLKVDELHLSKHDLFFVEAINYWLLDNNYTKSDVKILDWGCGRGRVVAILKLMGFNIFGVEIDPLVIKQSEELFNNNGWDHNTSIQLIGKNNRTLFADGFFDIIISDQVFEHVAELDSLLQELSRIIKPNGIQFHRFPAKYIVKEPHLHMPMVHWFPKGMFRKALIACFVLIGKDPKWKSPAIKSRFDKIKVYNDYSVQKTFYRSLKVLKRKISIRFDFISFDGYRRKNFKLLTKKGFKLWRKRNFYSVELVLIKKHG